MEQTPGSLAAAGIDDGDFAGKHGLDFMDHGVRAGHEAIPDDRFDGGGVQLWIGDQSRGEDRADFRGKKEGPGAVDGGITADIKWLNSQRIARESEGSPGW